MHLLVLIILQIWYLFLIFSTFSKFYWWFSFKKKDHPKCLKCPRMPSYNDSPWSLPARGHPVPAAAPPLGHAHFAQHSEVVSTRPGKRMKILSLSSHSFKKKQTKRRLCLLPLIGKRLKFDPDDLIKAYQNGSSLPNRERGVKERRQKKIMM